jgi:hypothetical protein
MLLPIFSLWLRWSLQLKPIPVNKWSSRTFPLPLKKHDKRKKESFQFLLKISDIILLHVLDVNGCGNAYLYNPCGPEFPLRFLSVFI